MSRRVELRDEHGQHVGYCDSLGPVYDGSKITHLQLKGLVLDDGYALGGPDE